jgi:hypothetical protein
VCVSFFLRGGREYGFLTFYAEAVSVDFFLDGKCVSNLKVLSSQKREGTRVVLIEPS